MAGGGARTGIKPGPLPQPFFEEWEHRCPLAKDDTTRKTEQVGTGLYAGPIRINLRIDEPLEMAGGARGQEQTHCGPRPRRW
jgi:hypothetical protein